MKTTLQIPMIMDKETDYLTLFRLAREALSSSKPDVVFDFSKCFFIKHNGVAFLGGLARLCEALGGRARFDWSTVRPPVLVNLQQNGFAASFGDRAGPWRGNSVPYRQDGSNVASVTPPTPANDLMEYLKESWLGRNWVHLSPRLLNEIRGKVWEIYANSFEHASSHVGTFTCGQHYPKRGELALCVVDFGVGIPTNVRAYTNEAMSSADALRWAFEAGHTTKPGSSRGLGLDILRNFIRVNDGRMHVYSHDGRASIDRRGESFTTVPLPFQGTVVDISLKCDEKLYVLASEVADGPLF